MSRYRYERITGKMLSDALNGLGITAGQFARLTGADHRRVQRWMDDEQDIPHHVALICALLAIPSAMEKGRKFADLMIKEDIE